MMSVCVEKAEAMEVVDCASSAFGCGSGSASDRGAAAFSDAPTLVRSCFSRSFGVIKQLVSRPQTDLEAAVSCVPSVSVSQCCSCSPAVVVVL